MMPAAKHFDPILGIDIHIIQPPGPVPPVPIPHPFIGFLIIRWTSRHSSAPP